MTIRDLRQRWPEAEAALELEDEIIITRDSRPVAKLVRVVQPDDKRRRWNLAEHRKWIKKVFGNKIFPGIDRPLSVARAERNLSKDR